MTLGSFIGASLFTLGVLLLLVAILPLQGWAGLSLLGMGGFVLLGEYRKFLLRKGFYTLLPESVNEFLTRTDFLDFFVMRIRDNSILSKISRIMIVKWFELSRQEIVDVLEDVWPKFRDLSEDVALLDLTPRWFKRMYLPRELEFKTTTSYIARNGGAECIDDMYDPLARGERDNPSLPFQVQTSKQKSIVPLIMWLAEKRIRMGMRENLPIAREYFLRLGTPIVLLYILWRKYPALRRPLTKAGLSICLVYLVSISYGLPPVSERIFRALNFSMYKRRGERPFRTDQSTGSLRAVLYAIVEPFVPIVNVDYVCGKADSGSQPPKSPALSQASTQDQTVI